MPNRILKETICTSEEIDALTADQECFFYRLMVVVDDFGTMDARPAILKARCYPLKSIDIKCVQALLCALRDVGLVQLYEVDGRPYLHVKNWAKHQQIRAKTSKYPMPSIAVDSNCNQPKSNVPVIQSNPIQYEYEVGIQSGKPDKPARFDPKGIDLPECVDRAKWCEWIDYRKARKLATVEATARKQVQLLADLFSKGQNPSSIIDVSIEKGWQGLFEPQQARASPGRKTLNETRAETIAGLTGRTPNDRSSISERDITGEAERVA